MPETKSARQKDEEAKLRAEVQNAPGWHRKKAQSDDDCEGCDEKKKRATKAQKAKKTEVKDNDASS